MKYMKELMRSTIDRIRRADMSKAYGVIGFDGFVDEVVHVVGKRFDSKRFKRIETISEYGSRISRAAGLSTNIEVVPIQRKIGGNGPIFGNALLNHGVNFTYIGALGYPAPNPIFADFLKRCDVISISEPGYTDAVEFFDGKIIRSKLEGLKSVSWEGLTSVVDENTLQMLFDRTTFLAFLNWSLVVNVTSLWKGLLEQVFPKIARLPERMMFVDLADPEKRSRKDLQEAIEIIERMQSYVRVTLGLNRKEACEIAALYGVQIDDYKNVDIFELLKLLSDRLKIDTLLIHSAKIACGGKRGGPFYAVSGPYCAQPLLTTGAGDNFNAGYVLGQIGGLTVEQSICLAVYNSGYYIRNAYSPSTNELVTFMENCLREQV